MKKLSSTRLPFCSAAVLLLSLAPSPARADYPIMSHRYLADPGSLVHDGRIYLYNSNDDDNAVEGGYTMHSIVCVSTSDLKNWTDHGIVFQVPGDASWANNSWAPMPIERDGKIYLYFGNSASGVGVATSTTPTGKFKDGKGGYLVNSSTPGASGTDSWLFDPGAFIDTDGQAYLSFGGNGENNARIIKLGTDLVSVNGSAASLSPKGFFEASFLFKRNDTYYFAYSTNSANGLRIDYLTSKSPMSGYTYAGILADQPPVNNNNNHASEFEFNGQWYHAYHNRTVSTKANISTTYKRNLAMEVLNFKSDGSIEQVKYTEDGLPQIGHLNPYTRVEAETMNAQQGIETEASMAGGMDVTEISDGDWIRVRGVDFGTRGATSFTANVAGTTAGSIELHLEQATGMLVGTCQVPVTGGAQTWMPTTCDVTGATGVHDLYLVFKGTGSKLFNVDYWQFAGGDGMAGAGGNGGGGMSGGAGMSTSGGSAGTSGGASGGTSGGVGGQSGGATGGSAGTAAGAPAAAGTGSAVGGSGGTSAPAGGQPGTGGAGATPGTGGSAVGTGGTSGSGSSAAGTPGAAGDSTDTSSGCGCRVAGDEHEQGAAGMALFGLALAVLRRGRRRMN